MRTLFLLLLLSAVVAGAQPVQLTGYYEPQLMIAHLDGDTYQMMSNKLRVDLSKTYGNALFAANFDYITYHGKTQWNLADFLPSRYKSVIPDFTYSFGDLVRSSGGGRFEHRPERIFLDNAFVRLNFERFDLTIGKQQMGMGSGYTWNPTDLFNVKDVMDPSYEQPGHNAVTLNVPLSSRFSIHSYYAPGEEWENSAKMFKVKAWLGKFDVSLMVISKEWTLKEYTAMAIDYQYKRTLFATDIAGELLGLGVWAEGGYNHMNLQTSSLSDGKDDYWEWVLGTDYTFDSGLYVMSEWYHNGMMPDESQHYSISDWLWMLTGEVKSLCRDQLFAMFRYPVTDLITAGTMSISSLSDGSVALVPVLEWSLYQDIELTIYGNIYTGSDGQLYAANMGNGGMARLRVYF
ncbi:MAG: hypothetical protein U5R06_19040 [candidate division KSB1 bacterium]|nr:hypothetical protein [candidate division KSB1 bacterium]